MPSRVATSPPSSTVRWMRGSFYGREKPVRTAIKGCCRALLRHAASQRVPLLLAERDHGEASLA